MTSKPMIAQSVVLSRDRFPDEAAARAWIDSHGFKSSAIETNSTQFRFRQEAPERFLPRSYRSKHITEGVLLVMGKHKADNPGSSDKWAETEIRRFTDALKSKVRTRMIGAADDKATRTRVFLVAVLDVIGWWLNHQHPIGELGKPEADKDGLLLEHLIGGLEARAWALGSGKVTGKGMDVPPPPPAAPAAPGNLPSFYEQSKWG